MTYSGCSQPVEGSIYNNDSILGHNSLDEVYFSKHCDKYHITLKNKTQYNKLKCKRAFKFLMGGRKYNELVW